MLRLMVALVLVASGCGGEETPAQAQDDAGVVAVAGPDAGHAELTATGKWTYLTVRGTSAVDYWVDVKVTNVGTVGGRYEVSWHCADSPEGGWSGHLLPGKWEQKEQRLRRAGAICVPQATVGLVNTDLTGPQYSQSFRVVLERR